MITSNSEAGNDTGGSLEAAGPPRLHGGLVRKDVRWHILDGRAATIGVSWYMIQAGDCCTLHIHTGKTETWMFLAGHAVVSRGSENIAVGPGDAVVTPPGVSHGIVASWGEDVEFVNIVEFIDGEPVTTTELGD